MKVDLSVSQIAELDRVLEEVVSDMSSEIAGTDNPTFRQKLQNRRDLLKEIRSLLVAAEGTRA